jgi:nuclease S1
VRLVRVSLTIVAAAASLLLASASWAWGCKGHQTVALIAEKHMSANAKTLAQDLLQKNPPDPTLNRYCKDQGPNAMTDAATWADDERSKDKSTGGWHFFDIPRGAAQSSMNEFCNIQDSCVTQALRDKISILKDPARSAPERADALRYIIHFVGDEHQPLHCTTNNDRGGNCIPVKYFDNDPAASPKDASSFGPNLHGIWDTNIVERDMGSRTVQQFADDLDAKFQSQITAWQQAPIDIDGWAWESHQVAEDVAYGKLPKKLKIEAPIYPFIASCADDNHVSQRMLKKKIQLAEAYQDAVAPVIEQRLEMAGVRLAMILNQLAP